MPLLGAEFQAPSGVRAGGMGLGKGRLQGGQGTLVAGALHARMRARDCVFQTERSHLRVTWAGQRGDSKQEKSGRQSSRRENEGRLSGCADGKAFRRCPRGGISGAV